MVNVNKYPKVLLIVLDGFGDGKDYPFNAITKSNMPFYRSLNKNFPKSQLLTCGEAVGLPSGIMGNSEVGHMNMGAGRIVYQELTRIDKEIREGHFQKNQIILDLFKKVKSKKSARLHLMGLLSDGGVHSHLSHLKSLLDMTAAHSVPVTLHVFTDGRDTSPQSGITYARELGRSLKKNQNAVIGTLSGRYFAMDRDTRWERTEKSWKVLTGQWPAESFQVPEAETEFHDEISARNGVAHLLGAITESYGKNITDEFIEPVLFSSSAGRSSIADDDGVFFFNFRADRARQLSRAFTQEGFSEFDLGKKPKLSGFASMTEYDKNFTFPSAYSPQNLTDMLPDVLNGLGLSQFRIAETEKYAHVTFFFNGSREKPYAKEERILVNSPKDVPTYDLKPEMSAPQVTQNLVEKLNKGDAHFVLVNYANPDMVGHTGNFEAALKALECVDQCLNQVISAAMKNGYSVLITADHGNVEEMRECNHTDHIHTQHTLNPVPIHLISHNCPYTLRDGGVLADVAPTILQIMGIEQPKAMTGKSLLVKAK